MIYGYLRVSTDKQTLENQEFEIKTFCEREHIAIDKWITETISGTKDFEKRKLGNLLFCKLELFYVHLSNLKYF